jgi:hypothetical protein
VDLFPTRPSKFAATRLGRLFAAVQTPFFPSLKLYVYASIPETSPMKNDPLAPELLYRMNAY